VCLVLRFIAPKDSVRSPSSSVTSTDSARSPRASVISADGSANGNGLTGNGPMLTVSPSVKEAIKKIEENDPSGAEKLTQIATRDPPKVRERKCCWSEEGSAKCGKVGGQIARRRGCSEARFC
jgi:hypothetical protein